MSDEGLLEPKETPGGFADGSAGFADGKEPDALRTIGEVARLLGIRQHVLRYWEEQFPMLKPLKRTGGRRYYRAEDVKLVETIDRLVHREGYTLKGACKALQSKTKAKVVPASPAQMVAVPQPAATRLNPDLRDRLILLRSTLANALHHA